jgi:hypothetical protein
MNIPEYEGTFHDIVAVIIVNIGAYLIHSANPILGTISLGLSVTYVGVKLYKEIRDFWNPKNKN